MPDTHFDILKILSTGAKALGAGAESESRWEIPTIHPDPIDLAVGMPVPEGIPMDSMADHISQVLCSGRYSEMEYEYGRGKADLRELLNDSIHGFTSLPQTPDNFILFNGSSGCMESFCATFIDPGDIVLVEGPSFSGTVETILKYQGRIIEIPLSEEGISVEVIENIVQNSLKNRDVVKAIYTIDDFHNPTGLTMSESNRRAIGQLALDNGIMILEDSTYSGLFFDESPPPDIYALNEGEGVMRMGTFSKTIATGLRLGWLQGSDGAIDAVRKSRSDMGNAPFIQTAVASFIESSEYSRHVKKMRSLYKSQCSALADSLLQYCSDYLEFIEPKGGFFLWPKIKNVDSELLTKSAAEEGLIFPDGSLFYQDRSLHQNHIRLAFSGNSPKRLDEVGLRLRRAFEKLLD